MKKLTKDLKNHDYFLEAYTAGVVDPFFKKPPVRSCQKG